MQNIQLGIVLRLLASTLLFCVMIDIDLKFCVDRRVNHEPTLPTKTAIESQSAQKHPEMVFR